MLRRLFLLIGFLILLLATGELQASPTVVRDLRASVLLHRVRLVFDLSHNPRYRIFALNGPPRVVIDLTNGKLLTKLRKPHPLNHIVRDIRTAHYGRGGLRIVLDLKHPVRFKGFSLRAEGRQPPRLVVDLILQKHVPIHSKRAAAVKVARQKRSKNVIIVIDPGHGGKDPGATGYHGTHEKNVVLAIGRDLQRMLDKQYGFTAKLTRTGDYFIPLRGRLAIERRDHADMFIAIHADAYKNRGARGASVFALSENGATSEAARWLAKKENESELGVTLANLSYRSKSLQKVLINLAQTASISTSLAIGDAIIHNLARVARLHHGFVEQAAFVVLKEPDVPSLLVETGFISNPKEELLLRSKTYQRKIALALMLGIKDYFIRHSPPGTLTSKRERNAH